MIGEGITFTTKRSSSRLLLPVFLIYIQGIPWILFLYLKSNTIFSSMIHFGPPSRVWTMTRVDWLTVLVWTTEDTRWRTYYHSVLFTLHPDPESDRHKIFNSLRCKLIFRSKTKETLFSLSRPYWPGEREDVSLLPDLKQGNLPCIRCQGWKGKRRRWSGVVYTSNTGY